MGKILILIGNPYVNFFDPNSAIGASLLSVKQLLEEIGLEVILSHSEDTNVSNNSIKIKSSSTKAKLKLYLKKVFNRFYLTISDYIFFKKQKKIFNSITEKGKIDHIIEFSSYGSDIGYKLKSKYNIPLTLIFDAPTNEQYFENHGRNSFYKLFVAKKEKKTIENADYLICYSTPVLKYLKNKFNLKTKKTYIFPTVNWNKLEFKNSTKKEDSTINIGFIGSFLKWHKVNLLVDAFDEISKKHSNIKLFLIGHGQEWDNIKQKIKNISAKDKIYLPGFVSGKKLSEYKSLIDIGIMPGSNWYGGPLKIFEYAYLKIPVIAPKTPTIGDIFEKDIVLYIDKNNELKSLVSQLESLIINKEKRDILGRNLYKKVKTDLSKETFLNIFKSILS